jgi:AcrR family transcriptional regulator
VDRRTRRSRQALHEALVALTLERGWDRVTVQAVCDHARVGRSTFYLHFADKEDALVGGLEHVRDDLRKQPRSAVFGFVRGLLDHADESRRLFRAVIGKRSGLAVQRRFREIVLELMVDELRAAGVRKGALATVSRFLSGALVELLFAWVDTRASSPAADLEREFVRLAQPVVASAR